MLLAIWGYGLQRLAHRRRPAAPLLTSHHLGLAFPLEREKWRVDSQRRTLTHVSGLIVEVEPDAESGWRSVVRCWPPEIDPLSAAALEEHALRIWYRAERVRQEWERCHLASGMPGAPQDDALTGALEAHERMDERRGVQG
jgi:hypothetical protein